LPRLSHGIDRGTWPEGQSAGHKPVTAMNNRPVRLRDGAKRRIAHFRDGQMEKLSGYLSVGNREVMSGVIKREVGTKIFN